MKEHLKTLVQDRALPPVSEPDDVATHQGQRLRLLVA